jgi:hypothetical protein
VPFDRLQVSNLLKKLFTLANFQSLVRRASNCSILFWHKELLQTFLEDIYGNPTEANRWVGVVGELLPEPKRRRW